jgi:hypothetical protein
MIMAVIRRALQTGARFLAPLAVGLLVACSASAQPPAELATPQEMAAAKTDLWGQAAIRQPQGPSYEFFRDLLPPLRYVNTAFRHYPIVLSAPAAPVKAWWVSNGSGINLRADKRSMWKERGIPVSFRVGDGEPFGQDLARLDGPRFADGWLPIVQVADTHDGTRYEQEAFAAVADPLAAAGSVLVRFTAQGGAGTITAHVEAAGLLTAEGGAIRDERARLLMLFGAAWKWDAENKTLAARLEAGQSAVLSVMTEPLAQNAPDLDAEFYNHQRRACTETWQKLLARGTQLEIPEPIVQDAWRALVVGNYLIAVGDRMNYSAGNAYDHLYEAECGDAVRSLLLFGQAEDARRMVGPLLDFNRQATRFHVAGHKLQLLAHYYWVTRDADYLRKKESVWRPVIDFIIASRRTENGLLPKDNYAGDINQQVYSLNSNANCWRGLADMAAVLADLGHGEESQRLAGEAAEFRRANLDTVAKSEFRDTKPPFIPNALFGAEPPHDPLTATRMGSYYDLMAPYLIGSGVFGPGSERESWLIDYLRQHGGIAMGMIRSMPHQGEFKEQPGVNVLYGLRYMLAQLRRDEREPALAGFYGQLAQGMTRKTFIGGEGSRFFHGDAAGRSFYLPPNSASNAMFLTTLRYLLVQDWDLDDDRRPETLRLLFGAPGRWLKEGAVLRVERAPSAFGEISLRVESRLEQGEVLVDIAAPPRRPDRWLLRLPLPAGWKVASARVGNDSLSPAADGTVDLSGRSGRFTVRLQVERQE